MENFPNRLVQVWGAVVHGKLDKKETAHHKYLMGHYSVEKKRRNEERPFTNNADKISKAYIGKKWTGRMTENAAAT